MHEAPGFGELPINAAYDAARAACELRTERLCTEQEWEIGCRGPGGLLYPYGDSFDAEICVAATDQPATIGIRNGCRSGFGLYDMSGNAAEWVEGGLMKGGAYDSDAFGARCGSRARAGAPGAPAITGFRCCVDPSL